MARRGVLLALLVLSAAGVLALATRLPATGTPPLTDREPYPVADHWPPFQMTYRVTELDSRTHEIKRSVPYLVEWTDRRHWRQTLLDQSGDLVNGGVEWEQDGDTQYFTSRPGAPAGAGLASAPSVTFFLHHLSS